MSGPLLRRLRLPAADTSPAAARRAVDAVLVAAELDDLRAEALLLTSELVTNGVLHAGTDLEVEIMADLDGVQITVTDFGSTTSSPVAAVLSATAAQAGAIPPGGLGGLGSSGGLGGLGSPGGLGGLGSPGSPGGLVVGDVSGKGVGAAAATGLVRDVLHTLALDHRAPEQTPSRLDATLVERGRGYFRTLALAFLQPHGTALGLLDEVSSPRVRVRLKPGDALVLYTDGVTERRRGRLLYGQRRLRGRLASRAGSPAATLAARLRSAVLAFGSQPPRDDIAIVALRTPAGTS